MKVLIGITSKNREKILPKAIESALSQTYPHKEVWVFDDASTDNTRSLAITYPNVKWIFSEEPKGYVYARNLFMRAEGSQLKKISQLVESGVIRPVVDRVFPFEKTNEALEYIESGRAKGKVVVKLK